MIAGLRAAIIIFYLVIAAIEIILGVGLFKLMEWARNGTVSMTVLFAMRGVFALLSSFPLHLNLSVILLRVGLLGTEIVIIGYLIANLLIGVYYRQRASGNTEEFFISGRDVSWWLAGTSMVATTFAADTPLLVCGLVARQGIAGNWIWWGSCVGGMLTVFFFARYWRRAEILTDVQLVEIRYGGKPAAFLRGFKAVYLGLFMNCFILGWVTQAMVNIITVLLGPMIAQVSPSTTSRST